MTPIKTARVKPGRFSFGVDKYKWITYYSDMKMTFKQYLENTKSQSLVEEVIHGGLLKMFKHLSYWFERGPKGTSERIAHLEKAIENAGGVNKFAMVVRRIPSVKSFILRHKEELTGDLAEVANLI
jgi:hypothetical protein